MPQRLTLALTCAVALAGCSTATSAQPSPSKTSNEATAAGLTFTLPTGWETCPVADHRDPLAAAEYAPDCASAIPRLTIRSFPAAHTLEEAVDTIPEKERGQRVGSSPRSIEYSHEASGLSTRQVLRLTKTGKTTTVSSATLIAEAGDEGAREWATLLSKLSDAPATQGIV